MSANLSSLMGFWITGTVLGLSAGFSPGPLLTLVISETLRHDIKAGMKVAIAPILTDIPIILFSLFLFEKITDFSKAVGMVSLLGGFLLVHMGYHSLKVKKVDIQASNISSNSFKRGILVNVLSPYPYLFWFSIGAPAISKAWTESGIAVSAYIGSFFIFLIGSKIFFAVLVGKSKSFLTGAGYVLIMRGIGIALCVFAFFLFRDGLKLTGLL